MERGLLWLQSATPEDAMEMISRALPDLIAAYTELTAAHPPLLFDEGREPWRRAHEDDTEPPDSPEDGAS